ncbi:hypothetical protein PV327_009846 [Microctonus hyperodae]|uniref:MADF domain-containing protein n=1 Tax=Microctonus hyperodae TaxID=165561 RepID=A0AA39F1T9_MICHY|nr:hypothetical protein PV327_009846 [Microctonus hyperodae]
MSKALLGLMELLYQNRNDKVGEKLFERRKLQAFKMNDVKRVWEKLRINYHKHCKDQGLRKSTRINLMDKNLDFFENIIRVDANEISSCNASNNCELSKRVLRSGMKLSAITETKLASSSMSLFNPNKTQTIVLHNEHQQSTINNTNNDQTNQENFTNNNVPANNYHKKINNEELHSTDKSNRILRPRQLETLTIPSKENRAAPSRSIKSISTLSKNKQKKLINSTNATQSFFESMAMTVSTFPAQYQASIKMEICNIVAKTERKLSMENKI